ncbi:unnamed protein product [Eruca vesicaria subsp. sativa]|uniref:GRF-type domain-containing protein n=1 Tax=Eruca vesicaria subsp. sativa TaxID=29727 RepID=A0ABC8J5U1_ERUVS|nr:unnamed protein product [Eruca vesicaria subsp. sativa]
MAQSLSSSTIEFKNQKGVVCYCNRFAKIVQAWTNTNPGRRFYSCDGRKVGNGYDTCKFFRWYDEEKPHGWQHDALIGARDVMRQQKDEINSLRNKVRALTLERENMGETPTDMRQTCETCEKLKWEVLVLNERNKVYRNVLMTSSIGFTIVVVVFIVLLKL